MDEGEVYKDLVHQIEEQGINIEDFVEVEWVDATYGDVEDLKAFMENPRSTENELARKFSWGKLLRYNERGIILANQVSIYNNQTKARVDTIPYAWGMKIELLRKHDKDEK